MAVLVKLGGSVLTERGRLLAFRESVARGLATELAQELLRGMPTPVLVFGTGRAGKAYARHFTGPGRSTADWSVYQLTTQAIGRLAMQLSGVLRDAGVPHALVGANAVFQPGPRGAVLHAPKSIQRLRASGVVPVLGGDVLVEGPGRYGILSSDTIASLVAELPAVHECVFVTDVDGVLDGHGRLIRVLDEWLRPAPSAADARDVTGGMSAKLAEAFRISALGKRVQIVNGLVAGRLRRALRGAEVTGTAIRGSAGVIALPEPRRGSLCLRGDIA